MPSWFRNSFGVILTVTSSGSPPHSSLDRSVAFLSRSRRGGHCGHRWTSPWSDEGPPQRLTDKLFRSLRDPRSGDSTGRRLTRSFSENPPRARAKLLSIYRQTGLFSDTAMSLIEARFNGLSQSEWARQQGVRRQAASQRLAGIRARAKAAGLGAGVSCDAPYGQHRWEGDPGRSLRSSPQRRGAAWGSITDGRAPKVGIQCAQTGATTSS